MSLRESKRYLALGPLLAVLVVGCGGTPDIVSSRPSLPSCAVDTDVFLPIRQGPGEAAEQSGEALDCFTSKLESGERVELAFILLGAEGQKYRAILQALENGSVNYFTENDWGWEIYQGCSEFSLPEPGVPSVGGCDAVQIDGPR